MLLSIQDLMTGLIDYAGIFPPAALDMVSAVRNYAAYRNGQYSRFLGRFIVPVARLNEFERAAAEVEWGKETWLLSALAGDGLDSDLKKIDNFNERISKTRDALIDTLEIKAAHYTDIKGDIRGDIKEAMNLIRETLKAYFEIPIAEDPSDLVKAIAATGARAKVRTGGVTADAFPSSIDLARFIKACAEEDVPFKATAGLHHPLRSFNRLTYAPDSGQALMHGFLNVFLAAAFSYNGMDVEDLAELLEERSPESFQFEEGSVTWHGGMVVRGQLRNTRNLLAISFGSCSFEEPIDDLKKINLM
jgi:hypothetical protein